jgi:serine protease inhibitor
MNDEQDVSRALRDAVPLPETPTGLLDGARRRRDRRRQVGALGGGAVAVVAAGALLLPSLPGLLAGQPAMDSAGMDAGGAAGPVSEAVALLDLPFETTDGVAAAAAASEALAWSGIRATDDPNRVMSPSSLSLSLAMAAEGAAGASLESANAALGLEGETRSRAYGALRQSLQPYNNFPESLDLDEPPETPLVHQANRLVTLGTTPDSDFLHALDTYFLVPVEDLDRAVAQENLDAWVREETLGLIEKSGIVVQPDSKLVLQDAILFAAAWRTPLQDESGVRFEGPDGEKFVPGASGTVDAPTAEGARWTAVRLAYDDALAADVILPREGVGPDDLTADDLAEAREALDEAAPREVFVRMPTFDLTGKTDLLETLPQVDLRDLSGMGPGLTVDQWVQQARLRVTAKGTVGAAVTEVVVGESAVMPPPDQFVVDRPYVFRVLDTRTGWPLFLAAVSDPTEE